MTIAVVSNSLSYDYTCLARGHRSQETDNRTKRQQHDGEKQSILLTASDTPAGWPHLDSVARFCFPSSNARSVADVGGDRALLPLNLREGWQRVNIDLERTVRLVFGTSYLTTTQVTLRASARIAKVFFQSESFSDYELPGHLRVVAER